jgi:hypothetical protein
LPPGLFESEGRAERVLLLGNVIAALLTAVARRDRKQREGDVDACVGYATFVDEHEGAYARWLDRFEQALTPDTPLREAVG